MTWRARKIKINATQGEKSTPECGSSRLTGESRGSVSRHPSGAPSIILEGNAKRRADSLGVTQVLITFTHEKTNAVAFAVAVRG